MFLVRSTFSMLRSNVAMHTFTTGWIEGHGGIILLLWAGRFFLSVFPHDIKKCVQLCAIPETIIQTSHPLKKNPEITGKWLWIACAAYSNCLAPKSIHCGSKRQIINDAEHVLMNVTTTIIEPALLLLHLNGCKKKQKKTKQHSNLIVLNGFWERGE